MIETIYRVNGKEFHSKAEAIEYQEYQKKTGEKVYCSNCKESVGVVGNLQKGTYETDWSRIFVNFSFDYPGNECEIEPKGRKYLCPQCEYKFKHQLEEYKNLIEKLFDDFNLRKVEENSNSDNEIIKSIIDIDDPNSMISKYVEQKNEEAKEWINNMEEES